MYQMNKDRFNFRVWNEGMFKDSPPHYEYADVFTGLTLKLATGNNPVEQCTGFKDINGNLVYEGDLIHGMPVEWVESEHAFMVRVDTFYGWAYKKLHDIPKPLITGNIHENAGEQSCQRLI